MGITRFLCRRGFDTLLSGFALCTALALAPPVYADPAAPAQPTVAPAASPELEQAKKRLKAAQQRIQNAEELLRSGSATLANIRQQIDTPSPRLDLDGMDVATLESLHQNAVLAEQDAQREVQQRSAALRAVETRNANPPPPSLPKPETAGAPEQMELADTLSAAIKAENEAYTLELNSQPIAVQLARAQLELAERRLSDAQARLQVLDQHLDAARLSAARATLQEAPTGDLYAAYPELQHLAQSNEELAQTLVKLTERLTQLTGERERISQQTADMNTDMDALVRQLDQFGFGPIMGRLLLEKRANLPSAASLKRQSQDNRAVLETLQSVGMKVSQEQHTLRDPEAFLRELMQTHQDTEPEVLRLDAEKLLQSRQKIFSSLEALKSPILQAIAGLEFALEEQRRVVDAYRDFIAKNLLWLPNDRPLWGQALGEHWNSMVMTLQQIGIATLFAALAQNLAAYPLQAALFMALVLLLLVLRPRLNTRLQLIVDDSLNPAFKVWSNAAHSLMLVLLLALPAPLLAFGLSLLLNAANQPVQAMVAANLSDMAAVWLNATLFLILVRPNGVAEKMFAWNPRSLISLRAALRTFIYLLIPLDLLTSVYLGLANMQRDDSGTGSGGGQLLLVLLLLLLTFILGRLLRPHGAFIKSWRATHPAHWLSRHATLIFMLALGLPLFFAGMAADGYTYSAGVLTQTFASTLWAMLALTLLNGFANMTLQRAYRRLAQQRRQREQTLSAAEDDAQISPLDMEIVARQSRRLLDFSLHLLFGFALYFIWAPVLPAFSLLDQINLWNVHQVINGNTISSAVSLGDALFTGVVVAALWVASRNLPGLMEIMLEQWTTHEAGTRYAITTIVRYIIISAGIVILLGGLGVQWSQLQWLVAALGVGLGFGLQEIFANFISGIIILLERPVRVGDMVTIGTQTGTIRRVHMRATILEDFDRKEIVVPNKMLITQQVTNWTLSDSTTRVLVDIGVAYGSDTRQVESLLLEAARSVPRLLAEPAPLVWFMGFGDNALNFRLRGFVDDADIKLGVTSELNYAIEKILRENNISIPFPQRDVHVPGLEELSSALRDHLNAQRAQSAQGASA